MSEDKLATIDQIVGTAHAIAEADNKLKTAPEFGHLVSPATRVGSILPGCGVAISVVRADPTVNDKGIGIDVFKIEDKLMLQKHVMDQIGTALGVNWDPVHSRRVDDASDPYYCHFRAVGRIRLFDGQWQTVIGNYELDLRDGSPRLIGMKEKQVNAMRKFIVQRAETGARCRAISSHGVRRSYKPEELKRPFIVAKLHFDGHTDDPILKREFGRLIAGSMLGASDALYGENEALPAPDALPALPPANQIIDEPEPEEPHEPPPAGPRIPYGPEKDTPIDKATIESLKLCSYKLATDAKLGENEEGDQALLELINKEIDKREPPAGNY